MKIHRGILKQNVKEVCETSEKEPVFLTHYNIATNVVISNEVYEALEEEILKKYKELNTK